MAPTSTRRLDWHTNGSIPPADVSKHTSKRRKIESDHRDGEPFSRALDPHRNQLEHEIEHGANILHRALKVARGFERQKLGRRQKAAKDKKDGAESARLEAEVAALKSLDLSVVAETHLHKTLLKTKSIASAPTFPHHITATVQAAGLLGNTATVNVTARLYNSNPVKTAMTEILYRIRAMLGLDQSEPSSKTNIEKGSQVSGGDGTGIRKKPGTALSGTTTLKVERRASKSPSPEWDGFSDDQQVAFDSDNEQEVDFSIYEARLAGSSDSDSEDDIAPQSHSISLRNIRQEETADASTSPSSPVSDSSTSPPPKKRKSTVASTASNSTFIPSLMGGYWSGSDSAEDDDDTMERNERKNRMGQQARRLLWEKKFGNKANHLKGQERDEGWDSRKGAGGSNGRGGRGRGRGRDYDRGPGRNQGLGDRIHRSGANSDPVASRVKGKKEDGPLHPSWEAAKKAKELKKNVAFQGKKVVFA